MTVLPESLPEFLDTYFCLPVIHVDHILCKDYKFNEKCRHFTKITPEDY